MQSILQQILQFFGHGFCHQYPERTLEAGGLLFPVCARDTGLYLGFILTLIIVLVFCARLRQKPTAMPPAWALIVSIALVVPMALDGLSSYLGLRETTNLLRYITGYLAGTGLAFIVSGGVMSLWPQTNSGLSPVAKPSRFACVLALSVALGATFYLVYPYLGVVAPFVVLICIWVSLAFVCLLIMSTTRLWPRGEDGMAAKRRMLLVLLALLAALAVMALLSAIASVIGVLLPWYEHP